jgi:hypothetical protein
MHRAFTYARRAVIGMRTPHHWMLLVIALAFLVAPLPGEGLDAALWKQRTIYQVSLSKKLFFRTKPTNHFASSTHHGTIDVEMSAHRTHTL